ncbi:response regulator [Sinorhizobium medicae]|uniref:response regulator n=1 Tax=Sinorhizobium medicae TaxID=110321 RepID=UPI0003611E66|nr:response regulator [Sinorhizobium medicae]MBO1942777.1 response regulator [Sinorhizobium medicae]MDX0403580.1 response regulator [Sinorhizobium medicae]MDX0409416.1 response regulator [Sinorhizobium medicae]MDX0415531.1 response regulator [Sinorhizobium medicae]MDX0421513.1 response regulator [Sinorhizobium medicae]
MEVRARILIVEDEWLIAEDHAASLREAGYVVVGPVPSVKQALQAMENQEIDLALLDIQLWKETSLPLAEHLKAKGVPFAFLSGYSDQKLPPDLSDREVIPKPVDAAFLAEAVARLCKHTG